jgi:tRNA-specific 2-thiouridylase
MRIVVAMSGGVDSSVAAALLAEQGHDVIGLSMQLYPQGDGADAQKYGACCTLDDLHDARRVAAHIGFPHYIINFESRFSDTVIRNFIDEYVAGRTPIPCAHCNSDVKFAELLERSRGLGASALATGHYARIRTDAEGRFHLHRGSDYAKDQSYFLFSLGQAQLAEALFPIGELDKATVRDHARRLGLQVAEKPDSQEICFVPDGDYAAFVEREAPSRMRPGAIVSRAGRVMGMHEGVHRFTVGQRKGLKLSASEPLYVLKIDAAAATVTVGPREALAETHLTATGVQWVSGTGPDAWRPAAAQIRHRHAAAEGRVRVSDEGTAEFEFAAPQSAVTPGQAVVFYDGDEVLGGGWIQ